MSSIRDAGAVSLIAMVAVCVVGCNQVERITERLRPTRVDVSIIRFEPGRFEEADTIWAYADERALPSKTRMEWARKNIRIGKISREDEARIEDVLELVGADVRVTSLEVPSGTVVPIEAGARIQMVVTSTSSRGEGGTGAESMLVFRVQVERLTRGEIQLNIEPAVVDSIMKSDLEPIKELRIAMTCRAGESILIGPATGTVKGLGAYLRSAMREGWIQVFLVRAPEPE